MDYKQINIENYIKMRIIRAINNLFGNKQQRLSVAKLRRRSVAELKQLYSELFWQEEKDLYRGLFYCAHFLYTRTLTFLYTRTYILFFSL